MNETSKNSSKKRLRRDGAVWVWLGGLMLLLPSPFFGGCAFLVKAPEEEKAPAEPKEIYLDPNSLQNTAETIKGEPLNDNDPKQLGKPEYYVSNNDTQVESGDLFSLQPIVLDSAGNEHYMVDSADPKNFKKYQIQVKLAGVYCPQQGEAGWHDSAVAVQNMLAGKKFDVEQDKVFPETKDDRKITRKIVVLKFKVGDRTLCFNQVMVRRGFAWVDLTGLTSFDHKEWSVDEEFARGVRMEHVKMEADKITPAVDKDKKPIIVKKAIVAGMGLWAPNLRIKPTKRGGEDMPSPTYVPVPATAQGGASTPSSSGSGSGSMMGSPSSTGMPPSSSPTGSPTGSPMGSSMGSASSSPTGMPPSSNRPIN